jgi:hypothetical protein
MKLRCISFLLIAFEATSGLAFVPIPFLGPALNSFSYGVGRFKKGPFSLSCQLDRIESKAVEKFTTQYEKLCKTCPTRLQPRVDTIIQMISGLPAIEREELFSKIAVDGGFKPVDVESESSMIVPTIHSTDKFAPQLRSTGTMKPEEDKMSKMKCKVAKNGRKLAVVRQLLATLEICSEPDFDSSTALTALAKEISPEYIMEAQEKFAEELAELQRMSPACRLTRKLKLQEKQAKYERKIAEYGMELSEMEAMAGRECVAC